MTPEEIERVLRQRRFIEIKPCDRCRGWGAIMYSNTGTWRKGGMAGQMYTAGVCDLCWGSGDEARPWADLRKLEAEEDARINARAATLLDEAMAGSFINKQMRNAQAALAGLIEAAGKKRKLPDGVDSYTWYALTAVLAKRLRKFAEVQP